MCKCPAQETVTEDLVTLVGDPTRRSGTAFLISLAIFASCTRLLTAVYINSTVSPDNCDCLHVVLPYTALTESQADAFCPR